MPGYFLKYLWIPVCREYWMIYRGQGFLTFVWFGSSPSLSPSPISKLDRRHTGRMRKRASSLRGGVGCEWSQIIRQRESLVLYKHSILSAGIAIVRLFHILFRNEFNKWNWSRSIVQSNFKILVKLNENADKVQSETIEISHLPAGLDKTRVFKKKPSPVVFLGFFGFFGFFWFFLGFLPGREGF